MIAPWNYNLPKTLTVGGEERAIRSDYRAVLDMFLALTDEELDNYNRVMEFLDILFVDEIEPEDINEAIKVGLWFINCGEPERDTKQPKLVDWAQDFNIIAASISKIIGQDVRGMDYLHWWSFMAAYSEIGECFFSQVVSIRAKLARRKSLDKSDREFYRKNKDIIDIKKKLTLDEESLLKEWM